MSWQNEEAANAMGKPTKLSSAEKCTQEEDKIDPIDSYKPRKKTNKKA